MSGKAVVNVRFLGGFSIQADTHSHANGDSRTAVFNADEYSKEALTLIQYLLAFSGRTITGEELITLWPSSSKFSNPRSFLMYNLVRARDILKKVGIPRSDELILSVDGGYMWNPDRETVVDIREFDNLARTALSTDDVDERISLAMRAIDLYTGNFLPELLFEVWTLPLAAYYKNTYAELCSDTVERLWEADRWSEIVSLSEHALEFIPDCEKLSIYYIRSLTALDMPINALKHYDRIKTALLNKLGVSPSEELKIARAEAASKLTGRRVDADEIKNALVESSYSGGTFYCDYNVFRNLVRIQARDILRSGKATQLVVAGFADEDNTRSSDVKRLESILALNLRTGDSFTRYNSRQFLVMLPGADEESAKIVTVRLRAAFSKKYPLSKTELVFDVFPLDPAGSSKIIP